MNSIKLQSANVKDQPVPLYNYVKAISKNTTKRNIKLQDNNLIYNFVRYLPFLPIELMMDMHYNF